MRRSILYITLLAWSLSAQSQGTELINNGTFDDASNWTTDFSINGGAAHYDNLGGGYLRQTVGNMASPIQNNTTYILTFDLTIDAVGGLAYFRIHDDINSNTYAPLTRYRDGSHQIIFTTSASNNGGINFVPFEGEDAFSIDNISLIQGADPVGSPYFISLTGHDANDGSISSPFATPERAFTVAEAGDSIYIRSGIYYRTQNQGRMTVNVAEGTCNQGSAGSPIFFGGYPPDIANGDSVIFDFSLVSPTEPDYAGIEAVPATATPVNHTGFSFSWINYLHLKDFTVRNVWQKYKYVQARGMNFYACNYLRMERVNVYNIGGQCVFNISGTIDPTIYIIEGDTLVADPPLNPYVITDSTAWLKGDSTYVINCDAYRCIDSLSINASETNEGMAGTWGVGFFFSLTFPTEYVEFNGCRTWQCADDGVNVQGWATNRMKNHWSFNNGIYFAYLDFTSSGNGYKLNNPLRPSSTSGDFSEYPDQISHWVTNSIAAYNLGTGFSENHRQDGPSLHRNMYNNLSYKDYMGFVVSYGYPEDEVHRDNRYINNIGHDNILHTTLESNGGWFETEITNSWDTPPGVTVTDADFLALPTDSAHNLTILSAPRQADGSLPDLGNYFRLATSSNLIDAGTDVGMSTTPDIGIDWAYLDAGSPPVDPPVPPQSAIYRHLGSGGKIYYFNGKYLK